MALFALLDSNVVVDTDVAPFPVNPSLTWVDVSAMTPTPGYGWTGTLANATWTFAPPAAPPSPTVAQLAGAAYQALLAGGLTLTSTGTPALNGLYAIDPGKQLEITQETAFITSFQVFTNGNATNLSWPQQNGTMVTFPTTASFMAFAKAAGLLVGAAKLAVIRQSVVMPSASATIA